MIKLNQQDILERLIFTLRLKHMNESDMLNGKENLNSLRNYHKKILIGSYYNDISDFTKYNDCIIFPTVYSLDSWTKQKMQNIQLFNKIDEEQMGPYLFKSDDLTGGKIVLCQNIDNLTKAYNIALVWYQQKYNPIEPLIKTVPLGSFNLILPASAEREKQVHHIDKGVASGYKIDIVGYLKEGTKIPQYTVLLFL